MKKLITLSLLLSVLGLGGLQAQCTPDPNASGLFYPAPTAPLPSATVGQAYAQLITVTVPTDTSIDLSSVIGFPFPAVTVTINTLTLGVPSGLPIGIFGQTTPGTGIINGGANGCIDVAGTPTTSGQYVINIPTTLNVTVPMSVPVIGGTAQTLPQVPVPYNIQVLSNVSVSPATAGFTLAQSLPNPTSGSTVINYAVSTPSDVQLEVMSISGQVVFAAVQKAVSGEQSFRFDASKFAPGMYLYRLSDGTHTLTRKMVVE
jgi:Secretion system C-terminal sorting domain